MLWEPLSRLRCWLALPKRGGPSGEGTDYRAVREHGTQMHACAGQDAKDAADP
jgi:hypothetical protein